MLSILACNIKVTWFINLGLLVRTEFMKIDNWIFPVMFSLPSTLLSLTSFLNYYRSNYWPPKLWDPSKAGWTMTRDTSLVFKKNTKQITGYAVRYELVLEYGNLSFAAPRSSTISCVSPHMYFSGPRKVICKSEEVEKKNWQWKKVCQIWWQRKTSLFIRFLLIVLSITW